LADFNGDGRQDTLWRNSNDGKVRVVLSNTDGGQSIVNYSHRKREGYWNSLLGEFAELIKSFFIKDFGSQNNLPQPLGRCDLFDLKSR
jgi:hypothetical protein